MNREQWERECAQQFIDVAGLDIGEAAIFTKAAASAQEDENGEDVAEWDSPAEAVETEISYLEE